MIRLNVNEHQLFDMIMAVYAAGADGTQADAESVQRREALLDKLHRAFDNKIMTTQPEGTSSTPRSGRSKRRTSPRRRNPERLFGQAGAV